MREAVVSITNNSGVSSTHLSIRRALQLLLIVACMSQIQADCMMGGPCQRGLLPRQIQQCLLYTPKY